MPVQGKNPGIMITLRTSLTSLTAPDQASKMADVKAALTTNAALFPNLPVPLATFSAKLTAIQGNLAAITAKEEELKNLRLVRNTLLADGRLMYSQNGSYVAGVCGDDAAKAALSGYEQAGPPTPAGSLGQVQNLSVSTGDNAGELDSQHDPVAGATGYESEISPDGNTGWVHISTVGISKETFTGLPPLTYRWIRTRAVKGNEHGPWSDPAKGLVP